MEFKKYFLIAFFMFFQISGIALSQESHENSKQHEASGKNEVSEEDMEVIEMMGLLENLELLKSDIDFVNNRNIAEMLVGVGGEENE